MKKRPRNAENEIAARLSVFFAKYGLPAVERVPIIGRTGPDFEINDFAFVSDLKSRIECPKTYIQDEFCIIADDLKVISHVVFPITQLYQLEDDGGLTTGKSLPELSGAIGWLDHMHEWVDKHYLEYVQQRFTSWWNEPITSVILHRPNLSYDKSMVLMRIASWDSLLLRIQYYKESEEKVNDRK